METLKMEGWDKPPIRSSVIMTQHPYELTSEVKSSLPQPNFGSWGELTSEVKSSLPQLNFGSWGRTSEVGVGVFE